MGVFRGIGHGVGLERSGWPKNYFWDEDALTAMESRKLPLSFHLTVLDSLQENRLRAKYSKEEREGHVTLPFFLTSAKSLCFLLV